MDSKRTGADRDPVEPLDTRHVFLDTEIFRGLGHNTQNPALTVLKDHVAAHRVVLHVTDLTLLEVRRQIREQVLVRQRELSAIEKDFRRWRKAAPQSAPKDTVELQADSVALELYQTFDAFIRGDCAAITHAALSVPPAEVFERYFDRKAPFDREGSKEFPDAFAVAVLSAWCAANDQRLYVVSADKAMARAAEGDGRLLSLSNLHDVLTRAAADLDAAGEAAAEQALAGQDFDGSFELKLGPLLADLTYVYAGDLADGEAYEGEMTAIRGVFDWSVVGLSADRVAILAKVRVEVRVEVQYENRDDAIYDKEDGIWFGAETTSTELEEEVDLQVLVEIERRSGLVRDCKLVTDEINLFGPSDWDY
jgi:hypothetical protein